MKIEITYFMMNKMILSSIAHHLWFESCSSSLCAIFNNVVVVAAAAKMLHTTMRWVVHIRCIMTTLANIWINRWNRWLMSKSVSSACVLWFFKVAICSTCYNMIGVEQWIRVSDALFKGSSLCGCVATIAIVQFRKKYWRWRCFESTIRCSTDNIPTMRFLRNALQIVHFIFHFREAVMQFEIN